ncbi:glutaredoxin 2 [Acerihabitans arboris]|uniref:Glutaredoxin 2 n=1 Tax=Acerihabitans arboris TaxID=2691583 RepID=A0A845SGR2_9GAMM|nr:glutaredoxin 2 [Acerihabitans arboris]NDL62582.1 glutaredoxin 2 [Acerihabitans arboris]
MKLYIYEHCPFCVKARMIFGLKNIPIELKVLANDDEATPIGMVGKKMAPILQKDDGGYMPESMDIVHFVDTHYASPLVTGPVNPLIGKWLEENHAAAYPLVLPRNVNGRFEEFATPAARSYFINKKEAASGGFEELMSRTPGLVKKVSQQLRDLEPLIQQSNACNGELSDDDFHLFARLRSLTIVAGLEWPARVAGYRDNMANQTQVNLLTSVAQ